MAIGRLENEADLERFIQQRLNLVQQFATMQAQVASSVGAVRAVAEGAISPPGTVLFYAASSAPTGYLLCDGASYLIADYPELSAAIRGDFGGVDATHFSVPDLQGRVPVMVKPDGHADVADLNLTEPMQVDGSGVELEYRRPFHGHGMQHTHPMGHTHSGTTGNDNNTQSVAANPHRHPYDDSGTPKTTDDNGAGAVVSDTPHTHPFTTGGASPNATDETSTEITEQDGPAFLVLNAVVKT